jgi:hypothetical protein
MTTEPPIQTSPATPAVSYAAPRSMLHSVWHMVDGLVYLLWLILSGFALSHHEKWGDEAQSWLLARDLSLPRIWFYELRYEGTPGLWHTILWIAQHIFHMPYAGIGPLGLCFAAAGAAFIQWRAPFPRPVRYLLLFSYFIVYQYAIVARSYTLLPLLLFAAASFFHDREHPERITILLVLLSQLSVHGSLLADAIALCYAIDVLRNWNSLSEQARRWFFLCAAILVADNLFLYLVLKPTPDVAEFAIKTNPTPPLKKLMSILSGAFLDYWIPSSIFLVILGAWFYTRRRLLEFLLPLALVVGLYVKVHGVWHHHGTAFVAVVASLWIAWPSANEQHGFNLFQRRCLQGVSLLLVLWFGLNVWDTAGALRLEEKAPYSGARDAANYLRPLVAQGKSIYGYDFSMNAIQAYYDRNIFANQPSTFVHLGSAYRGVDYDQFMTAKPDYVVVMVTGYITGNPVTDLPYYKRDFGLAGYTLLHVSPGWVIYKQARYDGQFYLIFARTGAMQ